jgi:hypothetical protein
MQRAPTSGTPHIKYAHTLTAPDKNSDSTAAGKESGHKDASRAAKCLAQSGRKLPEQHWCGPSRAIPNLIEKGFQLKKIRQASFLLSMILTRNIKAFV